MAKDITGLPEGWCAPDTCSAGQAERAVCRGEWGAAVPEFSQKSGVSKSRTQPYKQAELLLAEIDVVLKEAPSVVRDCIVSRQT